MVHLNTSRWHHQGPEAFFPVSLFGSKLEAPAPQASGSQNFRPVGTALVKPTSLLGCLCAFHSFVGLAQHYRTDRHSEPVSALTFQWDSTSHTCLTVV